MRAAAKRQVQNMKNSNGYTLIEMLLVLFIVLLLSSIVFHITVTISEKRAVEQFFQQLVLDIQEMQALAIEKEETIIMQFNNYQYKAFYAYKLDNIIFQKDLPTNIQLEDTSNLKRFRINANGEVAEFGTIIFNTPFGIKHLIIYITKGRLRLVEY